MKEVHFVVQGKGGVGKSFIAALLAQYLIHHYGDIATDDGNAYIQCFVNELSKYPTSDKLKDPELPNTELYRHEYTSPLWTPDFAGWSIVLAVVILVVIVLRLICLVILHLLLRYKYRAA